MSLFSDFNLWMFLAGLGIFLFGMHMLEESIRVLSGAAFKSMIRKYTNSRPRAIISGFFSTAVLQSSSAVSLMVLAFTGAGIMTLVQAISVMMGAKVGTTATAWIVAIFGFEFNIDTFSLPLIGIGGLGIILLAKSPKYVNISKFLVAFGFLFMGLDYMKNSVVEFSEVFDPAIIARYGSVAFALTGMILTAVMQSSSATIAIVLTMLFSGVIGFESGAAMVIGANVGTTVTVLLGSVGGIHIKKQAAVSQLVFTLVTAVLAILLLPLLAWIVLSAFGFSENPVLGLALFHTLFNLLGLILFYPFINLLAKSVEAWIPEKNIQLSSFIHKTDPDIAEAGIEAIRREIICQFRYSLDFIRKTAGLSGKVYNVSYTDLEKYHAEIFEYYTRLHSFELKEAETAALENLLRVSRNIMNVAKNIYESKKELSVLEREPEKLHQDAFQSITERLQRLADSDEILAAVEEGEVSPETTAHVEALHRFVEQKDKEFIRMCGRIFTDPDIKKPEITFLLMLNRIITQSCRMTVYGLNTLVEFEPDKKKPDKFYT